MMQNKYHNFEQYGFTREERVYAVTIYAYLTCLIRPLGRLRFESVITPKIIDLRTKRPLEIEINKEALIELINEAVQYGIDIYPDGLLHPDALGLFQSLDGDMFVRTRMKDNFVPFLIDMYMILESNDQLHFC
ncbi:MAG: hypothetical protein IJT77_08435 [Clostridia bacterium]|nr:hypothetical protein [Clostridia bacterium]